MSRLTADLLRVLAIFAVLVIHATGGNETAFAAGHVWLSDDFLGVLLNQLARFSVPVFVALSGFGLTMKYAGPGGDSVMDGTAVKEFYLGRAVKILLPFVFWTILYFFLLKRFVWAAEAGIFANIGTNAVLLLGYLATQGVDYHFYFFIIILQCYLLFPLLMRVRRWWVWMILLLVQLAFTAPAHELFLLAGIRRPSFFSACIIYWAFWFYTGIMLAAQRERIAAVLGRIRGWVVTILVLLAAGAVLGEYLQHSRPGADPGAFNHFSRWTVVAFGLMVLVFFTRFDGRISAWLERDPRRGRAVAWLAGLSFCVYIFHVWPLRLLEQLTGRFETVLFTLTLAVFSFSLAWLFSRLIRRPKWLRTVLGL